MNAVIIELAISKRQQTKVMEILTKRCSSFPRSGNDRHEEQKESYDAERDGSGDLGAVWSVPWEGELRKVPTTIRAE